MSSSGSSAGKGNVNVNGGSSSLLRRLSKLGLDSSGTVRKNVASSRSAASSASTSTSTSASASGSASASRSRDVEKLILQPRLQRKQSGTVKRKKSGSFSLEGGSHTHDHWLQQLRHFFSYTDVFAPLRQRATSNSARASALASASAAFSSSREKQVVWLDCDPGHDDAIALLLACHHPSIHLAGVSTVSGNAPGHLTYVNAAKLLVAFGADEQLRRASGSEAGSKSADASQEMLPFLIRGADEPLLKLPRKDSEIHGEDGLGGVIGL